jgi:hypothetical protein
MSKQMATFAAIPVVLAAGALAFYGVGRAAAPRAGAATTRPAVDEMLPFENGETLPPNHPPIGGADPPRGSTPAGDIETPALVWKMPATWQEAPNPNAMRLATYRVPGGVEVSVSRAGGGTEANIQRWIAQFDDVGRESRAERTVHGLHVVTVDLSGTYLGGGTSMGGPPAPRPDWTLVGAIVESRSPAYFFKMTGPAAAVRAARPVFDRFIDAIEPT